MPHRTPAPLRAVGALLRALLGLAVLVALVGGAPFLLLTVGHQPTELSGGFGLLMDQDDGSLFLVALTCIGWVGWAAFTFSVLVEAVAFLRRRSAPQIKGMRSLQSLASFLIGGIVLLAPTAASAATTAPAAAATTVHTVGEGGAGASPSAKSAALAEGPDWPQHTVSSTTELPWDLAEEYLGDGKRWKDIAALNPDIPQLAAGDQFLPKGAVIKLPADARPVAPATSAAPAASRSPAADDKADEQQTSRTEQGGKPQDRADEDNSADKARPESVTVREGDSLWSIADEHGDPADWLAIFEANKGETTPGGGTFTDPNLIFPGQELDLPQAGEQAGKPADTDTGDDDPKKPGQEADKTPAPEHTPDKEADQGREGEQAAPPAATPAPSRTAEPAPSSAAPEPSGQDTGRDQAPPAQQSANGETALAPAAVWMGAGALAAALVGTLATRRILQQRRRRPGRRIPMPAGRAAATEQGLRAAQHPTGFDLLGTVLRSLALNLAAAGRELPVLQAVVLHEAKVELHLEQDTAPMKPFIAAAGRKDLWVCPASSSDLVDEEALKEADAPYPALVSVGWDAAGRLVLVDLEHAGVLHLSGDGDFARHVLQAIAVELASTPLPGHLEVTALAGTAPGLDQAAPERVVRIDHLADAIAELAGHTTDQRRALAAVGASSLRAARLTDDAGGAWTPHVLLAADLPDDQAVTDLFATLAAKPRAAGAVITSSTSSAQAPAEAWTLECQGPDETIVLPGSHLPIRLQGLSDEHFADAIELLTLAASDSDVPAPDWTRPSAEDLAEDEEPEQEEAQHTDDARDTKDPSELADIDPDDDGMPAEYAELELDALADEEAATDSGEPADADDPVDLAKPDTEHEEEAKGDRPAGPSLADVLADDEDGEPDAEAPASDVTKDDGPAPAPAGGPADIAPAFATPCATPTPPTVHVTIPSPAPVAEAERADSPKAPAAQQVPPTTGPDLPAQPETVGSGTPAVLLLGPISVEGATGRIDSNRLSIGTELIAYLALNPGVDHHAIDDALWPGRLVNKQMRNAVISRTRSWLDKDTDGNAHLPRVQDTGDSRYRLGPAVACDWTRFQRFARTGLARHDEDGDLALRRALALVRGRPFTGIHPQRYAWAEPLIQEMVSAIVDVAYKLSTRRREADDIPGALWAAMRGLLAAEESEMLHRQIFLAHHAAGDIDALRAAAARLARINEQLLGGVDMEAETAELLRNLLPRPVTRAR
ncbi:LysM peptidoglycan-binding domain-containing protein [Streptomyces sp. NPDC002889]|uniref:LysM peptidoglycan-binding domain-containing protein n=1 Tax=Streptomyces sp. NPDC002889 TaxID=3364669 RepID=UPI00369DA74A